MTRAVESRTPSYSASLTKKHADAERARLRREGYPKDYPR